MEKLFSFFFFLLLGTTIPVTAGAQQSPPSLPPGAIPLILNPDYLQGHPDQAIRLRDQYPDMALTISKPDRMPWFRCAPDAEASFFLLLLPLFISSL